MSRMSQSPNIHLTNESEEASDFTVNHKTSVMKERRAGFIVNKMRPYSQSQDYSKDGIKGREYLTPSSKVTRELFNPRPKIPLPKISKNRRMRTETIEITDQDNRESSMPLVKSQEWKDRDKVYPFGKNTYQRAKSHKKQDSGSKTIRKQDGKMKEKKSRLESELQGLLLKKNRLEKMYKRKNELKNRLNTLEEELRALDNFEKELSRSNEKTNHLLTSKSQSRAKRTDQLDSKPPRDRKKHKISNAPEHATANLRNSESHASSRDNQQDEEAQFYEHRALGHKCLECRNFQLKIEDVRISPTIKRQYKL